MNFAYGQHGLSRRAVLVLVAWLLASHSDAKGGQTVDSLRLSDAAGVIHTCEEWSNKKAILFFFLAPECPAANGYSPLMARIAAEFESRGVLVYGVHCDLDVTSKLAKQHAQEFGLTFPILLDPDQTIPRQTGVTRTATAVVTDPKGEVLYRGRIDDRYPALGKRRPEARTHDLEDALNAVLAGKKPAVSETEVVGCPLPMIRRIPAGGSQ